MRPARTVVYACPDCGGMSSTEPEPFDERLCGKCRKDTGGLVFVSTWDDPWDPGVRPVQRKTGWGCSIVAHQKLGWCFSCPDVATGAEALAWRLEVTHNVVPGYTGAVKFSRELLR